MLRRSLPYAACAILQVAAAATTLADSPATRPDDTSKQALIDKMNAMQNQMNQMQTQLSQTQTQLQQTQAKVQQQSTLSAEDQARITRQVLDDADRRSQLLSQTGGNAGFDSARGFYIQSDDGQSYFHPGVLIQAQNQIYYLGHHPNGNATARVQFSFDGTAFSKDLSYNIIYNATDFAAPNNSLEAAWVQYTFLHDFWASHNLSLRAWQMKDPAFKEANTPDGAQLMVAPSMADDLVGGGGAGPFVHAVNFIMDGDTAPLHASLALTGGPNVPVQSSLLVNQTKQLNGVAGRVDYKFKGDWADTRDLSGKIGQNDLLDIGGGATGNDHAGFIGHATVDAQYQKAQLWNVYGALYADYFDNYLGVHRDDWGAVVQGGYFINSQVELAARYSIVLADNKFQINNHATFHELGIGANYFLGPDGSWGNHAKVSMDVNYLPVGTPGDAAQNYLSFVSSHGEWVLRTQIQFWI